ncbi:hypothetical protein L1987_32966 [Smallanthus sonchifolius]|uniref:Uncharacterized protein n=1 Tax=Smallanthus sonchifolius TaxID=185202 RepID=A0ACB9HQW9_9ASTR|nr:hypothetical protein L1987_32966 [Smallanthus sonchifolius]
MVFKAKNNTAGSGHADENMKPEAKESKVSYAGAVRGATEVKEVNIRELIKFHGKKTKWVNKAGTKKYNTKGNVTDVRSPGKNKGKQISGKQTPKSNDQKGKQDNYRRSYGNKIIKNDPLCLKSLAALHSARRLSFNTPIHPQQNNTINDNDIKLDPKPPDGTSSSSTSANIPINLSKPMDIEGEESIFEDHFDLISDKNKEVVMRFITKKIMPTQKDVESWCHIQSKYFFRICEIHNFKEGLQYINMEGHEEESEVESKNDETASFMKIDSNISAQGTQVLCSPAPIAKVL